MIDYEENLCAIFKIRGSVLPKSFIHSLPAAIAAVFLHYGEEWNPGYRKDSGIDDIVEALLWNSMSIIVVTLLAFRTTQAFGRFWEGTSLLHKMMGEWFDVATLLTTFSRDAKVKGKDQAVHEFRWTLVRLMSLMHGVALDELSDDDEALKFEVLDIHGLDYRTLKFLRDCKDHYGFNKVEVLQHLVQVLTTHNHHNGILTIPPPILGRIYQSLSRGLVNLLNAKKIKDTRFPFPYAQVILVLLFVHSLFVPVLITQVVKNKVFAAILSFAPVFGMFCVNFTAVELEMPFGQDDNDLPLHHFQELFNQSLLMLIHRDADHLCCTSAAVCTDFDKIMSFANLSLASKSVSKSPTFDSNSKCFFEDGFLETHTSLEEQAKERLAEHLSAKRSVVPSTIAETASPPAPLELPPASKSVPDAPPTAKPQLQPVNLFASLSYRSPRVPSEGAATQASSRQVDADWFQNVADASESHIDALRTRSEVLSEMVTSFPDALAQSNLALKEATDCIFKQLGTQGLSTEPTGLTRECTILSTVGV